MALRREAWLWCLGLSEGRWWCALRLILGPMACGLLSLLLVLFCVNAPEELWHRIEIKL